MRSLSTVLGINEGEYQSTAPAKKKQTPINPEEDFFLQQLKELGIRDIQPKFTPQGIEFDVGADEYCLAMPDVIIQVDVLTPVIQKPGLLKVKLTGTNNENTAVTCQAFTRVKLPNGNWYPGSGWLFGPYSVTFPPNSTRSAVLKENIPVLAPLGNYIYEANLGLLPEIWTTDTGNFEVE